MKKIPNLFQRDWDGDRSRVLPVLNTEADVAWVLAGEGTPTVKWDGSAVLVRDGQLFVRYDAKKGKTPPAGFEPCQEEDPKTGHRPGWIPANGNPAAKWHLDAFMNMARVGPVLDGTYEACGPQHQTNPYKLLDNILFRHGLDIVVLGASGWEDAACLYAFLLRFLSTYRRQCVAIPEALLIEGIVWHHHDGRMVKVLAADLGLSWKAKAR